ncbi:MAG: glycosyltransferase family 4 protein, partial [Chloroflexota bacterium]
TWTWHVPASGAARRVLALGPDVVHFHGLTMNTSLRLLQMLRGKAGPAIVGQHHGGRPAEGRVSRSIQKQALQQVERALFGSDSAAGRFVDAGLLDSRQVVTIMDKSTPMTMGSRPEARKKSGMHGSPVFLWFANLEADRDPMTAVQGFEHILKSWPKAQLYVYYKGDTLLTQLRAYVIARPALAGRVHFRGRPPVGSPEVIFNSADFLFQTDRRANNGHAVLEAMACGVIPIVSDVPLFRSLVDNGRCGFLFPLGEAKAMARQVLEFSPGKIAGKAALVHNWFENAYSYDALAGVLLEIYGEAIAEHGMQSESLGPTLTEVTSN